MKIKKKILSILSNIIYIFIGIYLLVSIPGVLGFTPLIVISGSMSPTYDKWSVLYYDKVIPKGTKTSSFIRSVTLNPDLDLNSTYIDATYTLNIIVDTIQADGATEEWGITSSVVSGL
jgi:signal peptidase I